MTKKKETDLIIIGGGPAGLSAAINGASEGLRVTLMDTGPGLGGQAAQSSLIENYPGFPEGVTGDDLLRSFAVQAGKFKADLLCPQKAIGIGIDGDWRIVSTDDDEEYKAKMVILSIGLSYRRISVPGMSTYMGHGVWYGTPAIDPLTMGECVVSIIGGANSAGQAAMDIARNKHACVKLLIRKTIDAQMSTYLIERIRATPNIEVHEGVEVTEVLGDGRLRAIQLATQDGSKTLDTNYLFLFIGAVPKTQWLNGHVQADPKNFLLTGHELVETGQWKLDRHPLHFETSIPGIFACGDVRVGSIKRVA